MRSRLTILFVLAGLAHAQPAFEAKLCQSFSQAQEAQGVTNEFLTSHKGVGLWIRTENPVALGHAFTASIIQETKYVRIRVAEGLPVVTNGKANTFGFAFPIAGKAWASKGGKFRFLLRWDKAKKPIVDLPFTIEPNKRWALLVGISDYPPKGPSPGDLPASARDAERMRQLLTGALGFPNENVTLVQDLEATSARLRKELTLLADKAGPNDAVLFYYCGHGTQIPDLDGDEPDGWDEGLATADVKPPILTTPEQLKFILSDDEIAVLLARFKTKNVTVIFDSCHSGTAVRAGEVVAPIAADGFYVGMNREQDLARKLVEQARRTPRTQHQGVAAGLDIDQGYVFLSGARSWETGMTSNQGCFFSHELRQALLRADGQSWDEIIRRLRPRVQAHNPGQSPQAAGATRRYPFSVREAAVDAPYVRPTLTGMGGMDPAKPERRYLVANSDRVALVSGLSSLVHETKGVICDVYPTGSWRSAHGRVQLTGALQTWVPQEGNEHRFTAGRVLSGELRQGDRLVPRNVRFPGRIPNVGFTHAAATTEDERTRMRPTLQALVNKLAADRSLRVFTRLQGVALDYLVVPVLRDETVVTKLCTPDGWGIAITEGNVQTLATDIGSLVRTRHEQFTRFNRISNPSPPFRLRVVVKGGENRRKAGELIRCRAIASKPCHLYAFTAMEGERPFFLTQSNGAQREAEFQFKTRAGVKGRLFVKVIASEKPLDVQGVQNAEGLANALRKAYPDASPNFVSTSGWADETTWIHYR